MKITFLDAETLGEDIKASIPELFEKFGSVEIRRFTSQNEVGAAVADSEVIVVNKIKLDSSNLKDASRLKLICEAATGFDNIDLEYCRAAGIGVCNVKGYSAFSVAQITFAMVLNLICRLPLYDRFVKSGEYTKSGVANKLTPVYHELFGKIWGVVGAGSIGNRVAQIAEAFGCRVIVCKRTPDPNMDCVDIDTLCKTADIISVHIPLNDETRNLINKERIAAMKPTAVFINTARGGVADEIALTEAIEENRLGGLGIDVYTQEPFSDSHPYNRILDRENTCFTPHSGWGAYEARLRCLKTIAANIESYLSGGADNRIDL